MTLREALGALKAKGVTRLVGMVGETNIDVYLTNAIEAEKEVKRWAKEDVSWAKYFTEHIDDHFIVETNGHYIIATQYDDFAMATYGDYESENEMHDNFQEWNILRQAKEIADKKVAEGSELDHTVWMTVAVHELRAATTRAEMEFHRMFSKEV